MVEPRDQVLDHEYDGIREYDNPTPGWWHAIFIVTAIFAAIYGVFWHFSQFAWTVQDAWAEDDLEATRKQFAELGQLSPDQPTMLRMMNDQKWLPVGASIFKGNCALCHGPSGQGGMVCPNLTDDYWKNVKTIADIPRVVANGANNGAMPAWKGALNQNEIILVSAYVASLRGHGDGTGRGPEGDKIEPWPTSTTTPTPAGAPVNK
jgi:cytochrome c oxidase cbb3-type subunit 3